MIGEAITLGGAVLVLIGAIGVVRFPDALARMHSLTKASTIGVALVAIGGALVLSSTNDITSAVGAGLLQLLTLPISASLLARATYLSRDAPTPVDITDELASRRARPIPNRVGDEPHGDGSSGE